MQNRMRTTLFIALIGLAALTALFYFKPATVLASSTTAPPGGPPPYTYIYACNADNKCVLSQDPVLCDEIVDVSAAEACDAERNACIGNCANNPDREYCLGQCETSFNYCAAAAVSTVCPTDECLYDSDCETSTPPPSDGTPPPDSGPPPVSGPPSPTPPSCIFSSNPSRITVPNSSTLSWLCANASSCAIDRGIGTVSPEFGSVSVSPPRTTTYTLSCSGTDGQSQFEATVSVGFYGRLKEIFPLLPSNPLAYLAQVLKTATAAFR